MLLLAAPAQATITIGQVQPTGGTPDTCGPSSGSVIQPTVTSGTPYVVPANGVRITSWSTRANSTTNQELTLRVLRPLGGASYLAVGHDGPRALTPSAVNTFQVNLAVRPGDVIGADSSGTPNFPVACMFHVPGETYWTSFPDPSPDDGNSGTFNPGSNERVNASAEIEVSNAFSFVGTTRNKKKGRATTTVSVPGPGTVAVGGKGLAAQSRHTDGGSVALGVIPNKKTRKKLLAKGKARVTPAFTYTPTGGTANTQPEAVKLILR